MYWYWSNLQKKNVDGNPILLPHHTLTNTFCKANTDTFESLCKVPTGACTRYAQLSYSCYSSNVTRHSHYPTSVTCPPAIFPHHPLTSLLISISPNFPQFRHSVIDSIRFDILSILFIWKNLCLLTSNDLINRRRSFRYTKKYFATCFNMTIKLFVYVTEIWLDFNQVIHEHSHILLYWVKYLKFYSPNDILLVIQHKNVNGCLSVLSVHCCYCITSFVQIINDLQQSILHIVIEAPSFKCFSKQEYHIRA